MSAKRGSGDGRNDVLQSIENINPQSLRSLDQNQYDSSMEKQDSTHARQKFKDAYHRLEETLRDYNREKFRLEGKIELLEQVMKNKDVTVEEQSNKIQDLVLQIEKLEMSRVEDEKNKCIFDATYVNFQTLSNSFQDKFP